MPYRSQRRRGRPDAPQRGLVADMVRQFADPYAFLRELVQNSVDAGATRIDVTVELVGGNTAHTRVSDDGSGMTQEILENNLCTLFASTKEHDASKVGKYGVGFVSVLAVQPDRVEVETWHAEVALVLTLHADHTWELRQGTQRGQSGTRVTLVNAMDRTAFGDHAQLVADSLRRWCRHARVPILLSVVDPGDPSGGQAGPINAPFTVFSPLVCVRQDGDEHYVVGCSAGSNFLDPDDHVIPQELDDQFAGFYNRGLTLYETDKERFSGLDGVRFKIASAAFAHTLSRDNVRRDAHFDRAIARVRQLVRVDLRRQLAEELAAAAAVLGDAPSRYLALLTSALNPPFHLRASELTLALTDAVQGRRCLTLEELAWLTPWTAPVLVAEGSSPLTRTLAAKRHPVLWDHGGAVVELVADALRAKRILAGVTHTRASSLYTLVVPISDITESDEQLLSAIRDTLLAAGVRCARVILAVKDGRPRSAVSSVLAGEGPWLLVAGARSGRPSSRMTVALDAGHVAVKRARQMAPHRRVVAAQLLARLVLLEAGSPPSAGENEALLCVLAREGR